MSPTARKVRSFPGQWRRDSRLAVFTAIVALSAVRVRSAVSDPSQVPCTDPRGCPDIIVDPRGLKQWHVEERFYSSDSCAVVEGATDEGTRRLLRFTATYPNLGPGDLIVGDPVDGPNSGFFEDALCHRHRHFSEYADYRQWTPEGYADWQALKAANPGERSLDLLLTNPEVAMQMVQGRKLGFCIIDVQPYALEGTPPGPPQYLSCRFNQGIGVGWADEYHHTLDGQWIDVTTVSPGDYVLEVEVNASICSRKATTPTTRPRPWSAFRGGWAGRNAS